MNRRTPFLCYSNNNMVGINPYRKDLLVFGSTNLPNLPVLISNQAYCRF